MGTILYNGPFNPQRYETSLPPYQNFTMQVPSSVPIGTALIGVAHFSLVAVSGSRIGDSWDGTFMTLTCIRLCVGWTLAVLGSAEPDDHHRVR